MERHADELDLLDETEAEELVDPVGMIDLMLTDATLVSDEAVNWESRPARLLALGPAKATEFQSFTFQQSAGRLLVATARKSSTGKALVVLRSSDSQKMKVTGIR